MAQGLVDRIWKDLRLRVGADLRAVTEYEAHAFDTRMRDDVRESYTPEDGRELIDRTIIDQFSERAVDEQFKAGDLQAVVQVFVESWVVVRLHRHDVKRGTLVSIDRNGPNATMEDVDYCIEYLVDGIAPAFT